MPDFAVRIRPGAPALPAAVHRRGDRRSQGRRRLTRFAFPRGGTTTCCGAGVSAPRRRRARRARSRAIELVASKRDGDGRWPSTSGIPVRCRSRRTRARAGRAGGAHAPSVELVFSRRLTQMLLEGGLATSRNGPFSDTTYTKVA
jgi:hypothetical protein